MEKGAGDGRGQCSAITVAEISKQLKEAEQLRLDAEALKAEYEAKLAAAAKEADDMRARAEAEAETLVTKAKADATALMSEIGWPKTASPPPKRPR